MSTKQGSGPDAGEYTLIEADATAYTESFPTCGNTGKVRDHVHRRLIDLPIVGFPTRLHVRLPRYRCITPDCDVKYYQVELVCADSGKRSPRSEEHTSELQSRGHLVCRLLLEKKNEC